MVIWFFSILGFKDVQAKRKCHYCLVDDTALSAQYDEAIMPRRDPTELIVNSGLLLQNGRITTARSWFNSQSLNSNVRLFILS